VIKKLTAYIILLSMTLHCACRLGVIDRVYKKRNEIAFAMGFIAEIPISICSSDYKTTHSFKLDKSDVNEAVPGLVFKTEYINLFLIQAYKHPDKETIALNQNSFCALVNLYKFALSRGVFHPPSFSV
jgi:hypothetical protein